MSGRVVVKKGDLQPVVDATLYDRLGPVNLAGATVRYIMKHPSTGVVKVNAVCALVDATNGVVRYTWAGTDTDTAGTYRSEFEVTYSSGAKETFPNDDYILAVITDDLA